MENWQRDKLCQNRRELVHGWRWDRWCGERTQVAVVESLQRSAQTTVRPSFLLLDTGSGRGGVPVPCVQVLGEPGWEEEGTSGLWLPPAGLWRDAGISSSFSCTEAGFCVVFTSCSFEVEGANTCVAVWHDRWGCRGLEGRAWCLAEKVPAHVLFRFSNVLTCCVRCHLCWWGFGLPLGPRITRPAYKLLTITEVAYKDILFFSHARVPLSRCLDFLGLP